MAEAAARSSDDVDDESWDAVAPGWDDDPAARAYAAAAHRSLLTMLEAGGRRLDGRRVLDFGCGTGLLTERLADRCASIDAVDTSPAMLDVLGAKARRRGWANVRPGAVVGSQPDAYDLIVCSSVCAFLDDYPETVAQLTSLLAPGGVFVQWDWERDEGSGDAHGLSRSEILGALRGAGLESVAVDTGFDVTVDDARMRPLMGVGVKPPTPGQP